MAAHIRRRTAPSTSALFANFTTPAIPHMGRDYLRLKSRTTRITIRTTRPHYKTMNVAPVHPNKTSGVPHPGYAIQSVLLSGDEQGSVPLLSVPIGLGIK